uniref:C-type lectin domain-containing protein n=1 Tax=Macrostomum lignano TaxID=282301 RepID=A0A1I8JCQ0_9PLAT
MNSSFPHTVAPPMLAKEICESMHWNGSAHLASPKTVLENQLFYYMFYNSITSGQNLHKFVHIDGQYNRSSGQWKWWDGSPVDWKFWRHSSPGKECLMMDLEHGGTWRNIKCDTYQSVYQFICEVNALNTGYSMVSEPINITGNPVNYYNLRSGYSASAANDGDFTLNDVSKIYSSTPVTSASTFDWWRVDMRTVQYVSEVWIYLRSDVNDVQQERQAKKVYVKRMMYYDNNYYMASYSGLSHLRQLFDCFHTSCDLRLVNGVPGLLTTNVTSKSETFRYTAKSVSYKVQSWDPESQTVQLDRYRVGFWPLVQETQANDIQQGMRHGDLGSNVSWASGPTFKTNGALYLLGNANSTLQVPASGALEMDGNEYTVCFYSYFNQSYDFTMPVLQSSGDSLQFRYTDVNNFEARVIRQSGAATVVTGTLKAPYFWHYFCVAVTRSPAQVVVIEGHRTVFSSPVTSDDPVRSLDRYGYRTDALMWICCDSTFSNTTASGQYCAVDNIQALSFAGKHWTIQQNGGVCPKWTQRIGSLFHEDLVEGSLYDAENYCRMPTSTYQYNCPNSGTGYSQCNYYFCDENDPRPTLGSWRAGSADLDEWLQLSFSRRVRAESITIGSTHCYHSSAVHELIQRYVLEYSDDSLYWYRYTMPMYHYRTLFGPYNSPDTCGSSTERLIPSVEAAFLRIYSLANTGKLEVFGCVVEPYALILPEIYYHPYQVSTTKIGNQFNADHVVTSISLNWGTDVSYDGVYYRPGFRIHSKVSYLIVTFEIPQRVFAVVTAGGSSHYVVSYELFY